MERPFDTRHILSPLDGRLSEIAASAALVPTERVMELINLGAIYVDEKRVDKDFDITAGTYIRLHLKPKRYPTSGIKWTKHVVFQNEHMVVVNKPPRIPVHPMLDNKTENVAVQLGEHLGHQLFVTQRLDIGTQGLFVLAKTKEFQRLFNSMLAEKRVYKAYRARIEKQVETGLHRHFMLESPKSPKIMQAAPGDEGTWHECQLKILSCRALESNSYDAEIELITGRTHQIRAQLAFMGSPLFGDRLYGSEEKSELDLVCHRLSFQDPMTNVERKFQLSILERGAHETN